MWAESAMCSSGQSDLSRTLAGDGVCWRVTDPSRGW